MALEVKRQLFISVIECVHLHPALDPPLCLFTPLVEFPRRKLHTDRKPKPLFSILSGKAALLAVFSGVHNNKQGRALCNVMLEELRYKVRHALVGWLVG